MKRILGNYKEKGEAKMKWISAATAIILVAIGFVFLMPQEAHAEAITWEGDYSNLWSDSDNWSLGRVPNSDDNITIDSVSGTDSIVYLDINFDLSGSLIIEEGDTLWVLGDTYDVELHNLGAIENSGCITNFGYIGNDGTIDGYGGIANEGIIQNDGSINLDGGPGFVHGIYNVGTFTNQASGVIENNGTNIDNLAESGDKIGVFENYGYIHCIGSDTGIVNEGTFNNHSSGIIESEDLITNFGGYYGAINNYGYILNTYYIENVSGTINNYGTLTNDAFITNDGTINNYGTITSTSYGEIENNGTIANFCDAIFNDEGTFIGNPMIDACNEPPGSIDDFYSHTGDAILIVSAPGVLLNDTDPDGDDLVAENPTDPANGSVTLNADGSFSYIPDTGFRGVDSFSYTTSDGNGGTDTALVTITVNPSELEQILGRFDDIESKINSLGAVTQKLDIEVTLQAPDRKQTIYHFGTSYGGQPVQVSLCSVQGAFYTSTYGGWYEDINIEEDISWWSWGAGHFRIKLDRPDHDDCYWLQFVFEYYDGVDYRYGTCSVGNDNFKHWP
ncbi:MAG TPA: cadherin-like domain-containing protein [Dehalococcoidia bacterium]|nr:cadherin-like domain-containing protein [Dehalococcoidia bacterium]